MRFTPENSEIEFMRAGGPKQDSLEHAVAEAMTMRRLVAVLAALGLVVAATACERPDGGAAGPESILAPSAVLVDYSQGYRTPEGYTLLRGPGSAASSAMLLTATSASRSTTIGYNGGTLTLGSTVLTVPVGAVRESVRFTMAQASQPYLSVKLTAVKLSDGSSVTLFAVPLTLKLSYADSPTPITDPSKLKVYYVVSGKVIEPQPTVVNPQAKLLYATLRHFSEYSPGLDP